MGCAGRVRVLARRREGDFRMPVESEAEGRAEALRRIALCRESHADALDLGGLLLTELPDAVLALGWLRHLDLGLDKEALKRPDFWGNVYNKGKGRNALTALPPGLASLDKLTSLNLAGNQIGDDGARHLAGLGQLTSLDLRGNSIGDDGARHLAGLGQLTSLDLWDNQIGDDGARHLAGLGRLTSLDLWNNKIGDDGARHLAGLGRLTSLDLSGNRIEDLSPLLSLPRLAKLNLSGCRASHPCLELWRQPALQEVILHDGRLPGVPVEVLSTDPHSDNCLPRLRAHFADLEGDGGVIVSDVKVMVLGNGRVGKTKISRRLRGENYGDDKEPSTHGVQVTKAELLIPGAAPTTLRIWDFGGQDIYHGTHALFLKSRAIFPVVWTPAIENVKTLEHDGFPQRNEKLGYWLAYVRQMAGARSPVLIIQSQADKQEDDQDPKLPPEALEGFKPVPKPFAYSAKNQRGRGTLNDRLIDAVAALRDREGEIRIGAGRAWVKAEIERIIEKNLDKQPENRVRYCEQDDFAEVCALARERAGPVTSDESLLEYLHNVGTVFYRKGLFGDRIILDQAWALDAV